jgi:drug/metabolite transporter (DMT)-like permease
MKSSKKKSSIATMYALLAALFYGLSIPTSKLLLLHLSPVLLSSLLYFGAGFGMFFVVIFNHLRQLGSFVNEFKKRDIKYIIFMILLDVIAPILLMIGLTTTVASTASLLNNFEIVFTAVLAMLFFKERVSSKMWISIMIIVFAGLLLSFENVETFQISLGAIFLIAASLSWGLENNFTRLLSIGNPLHVVILKGIGSGLGSLLIAISLNQLYGSWDMILVAIILGFVSYGLSLFFYITAQRVLGATKTSAFYAVAPFIGSILSVLFFNDSLSLLFALAFVFMIIGSYLAIQSQDTI